MSAPDVLAFLAIGGLFGFMFGVALGLWLGHTPPDGMP